MLATDAARASKPAFSVSVVTPTLNRPKPLRRALRSLLAQSVPRWVQLEIVVVDNSPDQGARLVVDPLRAEAGRGLALRYVSEPQPGVATARNRGVREARGDWIAFLDDDEEASPDWIAALCAAAQRSRADLVFGPVVARAESGPGRVPETDVLLRYFERRHDLAEGADVTRLSAYLGTNNSMLRKASCFSGPQPFEKALNETGGEDSLLLLQLRRAGRRFAWAPEAVVVEWVPASRLTWDYVHRRKFLSGQIRTFVHHMLEPARWQAVAFWMVVGVVQATMAGAAAILVSPLDGIRSRRYRTIAIGGLGKALWGPRFRPKLYGRGLVS